jgi:NAD(P)-dependent dehydrogenase (short-subunit alcohol dehydrogenase family)
MSGRLAGRVAFISGAARGQGRAHAVRMAREGADIIAVDIAGKLPSCVPYPPATEEDLTETVRLVKETDRRILASIVDTRDFEGLRRAVDDGGAALGRLDIIVANACVAAPQAWNDITPESFRDVMDVNVTGTWNTVMAGADKIIEGRPRRLHHPDQFGGRRKNAAVHGALHRQQARRHRVGPRLRRRIGQT